MRDVEPLILIVDDREENRYTVRHALTRAGMQTIEAASGREALEQAKSGPDVIVLDVRLPDMLGYEVCRRLRANAKTSHIPVLQLSATFLTTESKLYALESGADAYLVQPTDPLVLVATVRSLIRLRKAEQLARVAAQQWASTFDALSEGVALVENDTVRRCNRAMTSLLGVPYSELEGANLSDLVHVHFGLDATSFEADKWLFVQREGRFFRLGGRKLPENDGTPGSIFIVADVTPQKQAEQALLLNERLAATGRMAHTIAHEINNPLEAITNLVYLAQTANDLSEETRSYLSIASDEILRISQITRQILSFNREATQAVSIPIAELLEDLVALSGRHEAEKRISMSLQLESKLRLTGYPARLRQALANLIRNAIEASEDGGIIKVRLSESTMRLDDHVVPAVRISVADRGSGIPPEHRDKIFEAFYTTKAQKGSGIGLWLTLSIIQEHRGKLQLRTSTSSSRHGTIFSVLLPS